MENLNVTTILPTETFSSKEEWMNSIGLKPVYREDGTSIAKDVVEDEWIYINRINRGIKTFTKKTWEEFVSHRKYMLENFYNLKTTKQ
jgi:hypothetical protein